MYYRPIIIIVPIVHSRFTLFVTYHYNISLDNIYVSKIIIIIKGPVRNENSEVVRPPNWYLNL